ncbi:MAG: hypothetical protein AB1505_01590 [Candidatus Latescibacterota bacterium]
MPSQRRSPLGAWFSDVGYLYLVAAAFVALVFAIGAIRPQLASVEVGKPRPVDTHPWSGTAQ